MCISRCSPVAAENVQSCELSATPPIYWVTRLASCVVACLYTPNGPGASTGSSVIPPITSWTFAPLGSFTGATRYTRRFDPLPTGFPSGPLIVTRSMNTARRLQSLAAPWAATLVVQPGGRYAASAASGTLRSSWNRVSALYSCRVCAIPRPVNATSKRACFIGAIISSAALRALPQCVVCRVLVQLGKRRIVEADLNEQFGCGFLQQSGESHMDQLRRLLSHHAHAQQPHVFLAKQQFEEAVAIA